MVYKLILWLCCSKLLLQLNTMVHHGKTKKIHLSQVACLVSCLCITSISEGRDTLQVGEILKDWDVLESSGNKFQLLFFGSSFSSNNYLGIRTTGSYIGSGNIWVANRDSPLADHSGFLNLTSNGTLMINSTAGPPFIVNPGQKTLASSGNLSLTLLDSGNLVLREGLTIIWQSLDFPVDTWLPGMKIGLFGLKSGQPRQQVLVSWLSPFVPSSGSLTLGVDPNNTRQLVIWRRGAVYWRSGTWDGQYFPRLSFNTFKRVSNQNESYFTLSLEQGQVNVWITLNSSGSMDANTEVSDNGWFLSLFSCENNNGGWGDGCVNALSQSNCSLGDEFLQTTSFSGFFDYWNYTVSIGINDCREICKKNCSCIAYASANLDGTGCMFTSRISSEGSGLTSKNAFIRQKDDGNRRLLIFTTVPVASLILVVILISLCYWRRGLFCLGEKDDSRYSRQDRDEELSIYELNADFEGQSNKKDTDLPFFRFSVIQCATNDFSIDNKLGQGGFGPVYKGKLENGQEIAVKRLARNSGQGTKEFRNEVILISKLQHRNLVRLLGCCTKGEEKLLIYEYMPNNSLDSFIFDATKRILLDWSKRFFIMEGIAQGLLYLHKHSRLRIIHRDLKTSNILLDSDLTPKISDFGTARIFGDNESRANTNRIVGTYGYMSPEYAMDGLFSVKSDVFSYGVMMLEIISGKKNTGFYHADRFTNLLGYAWDLWKIGKSLELMDPELEETSSMTNEVIIRCVQIALLCVQENAGDRPNMSDVLSMLTHETIVLPIPKQPAFFLKESANQDLSIGEAASYSVTKVTVSDVTGR